MERGRDGRIGDAFKFLGWKCRAGRLVRDERFDIKLILAGFVGTWKDNG